MKAIQEAIARLGEGDPVGEELAGRVAGEILAGEATPAQIGAFLTALRIRGERAEHLLGFARRMRAAARPVRVADPLDLVDTCGTGGDAAGTFNVSTAAALIAAGAGVRVAKHGNRAVTGRCGSADVLQALGVDIECPPEAAERCLREAGLAFFFAPTFHAAMRHAAAPRREIGVRTIFNMLGPLANPAGARRQLIGVYDQRLVPLLAETLLELGSIHALVVHGEDGLDEITVTGPTHVAELRDGTLRSYTIEPEAFGLRRASPEALRGGDAALNAAILRSILTGEAGPPRDAAALNAAAALVVGGRAADLAEGLARAGAAIESGAAARALERLVEASRAARVG